MALEKAPDSGLMTPRVRQAWAAAVIFTAAVLVVGALVLPFKFESSSILYKFGLDKTLLRTGKLIGMAAAMLLLFQLPLAGRLKILDRIFSLPALYRVHRIAAYAIGLLAMLHPVCVLLPDDMYMIPLEAKYWPEWLGAGLLTLILGQVVLGRWRRSLSIRYHRWLWPHRLTGLAAVIALVVHVLFVSETFESGGLARMAVFITAGCWALVWAWVRLQSVWTGRRRFTVTRVAGAGKTAYTLDLAPDDAQALRYAPGQFAFISLISSHLSHEVHPFTLASTPTRPEGLQVTVRCSGDWTENIGMVREGDSALIQGPFGHFTHLFEPPGRRIVMIAGGIGITPMLSMLRFMRDTGDPRPVTLIWSNRSEAHLFGRRELRQMQQQLTRFQWVPIFTREKGSCGHFGRLDRRLLETLLADIGREAAVFLCGPPVMIRHVRTTLRQLGFAAHSIKQEAFSY